MLKWLVPFSLIAAGLGYVLLWPFSVDPVVWNLPKAPRADIYSQHKKLADMERLFEGIAVGPEAVAIDSAGRIYSGLKDGRVIRMERGAPAKLIADTGGRPLGIDFDGSGSIIVADALRGLLSVSPWGSITVLATEAEGLLFRFANDVAVATDGTILFTDSSWKRGPTGFLEEIIEHRPNGRLLAYDPSTGKTRVLLDNLYFPNGVAISPDQRFVLVSETTAYRVTRYWLTGSAAGTVDTFVDGLPGFPDGISSHSDGFWIAIFAPRSALLDALMPYPFLRKLISRLPDSLLPKPTPIAWIIGVDNEGNVVHSLQDPSGRYGPISSVIQHGDILYLGSLTDTAIGKLAAPD